MYDKSVVVALCNNEALLSDVNELNKVRDYVPGPVKEYIYKYNCSDVQSCTVNENGTDCTINCGGKGTKVEFTTWGVIVTDLESMDKHIKKLEKGVADVLVVYTPGEERLLFDIIREYNDVEIKVGDVFSLRNLCYSSYDKAVLLINIDLKYAKRIKANDKDYYVFVL
ncbi:hypothetical protein KN1_10670 [Stygiolobus caldivivus]|uniref:Uncharacterized protein n=2 Tax=Stygiolobus caldivivus TaxID=2824673 RepID=A0A8D5U645_9CREN|nr:hypothetical protein KN1_10670 [Stygiolobus caldivivus]